MRHVPGRRPDAGMSLTETLVSVAITSLLLTGLASLLVATLRANAHLAGQLDDVAEAQLISEVVSRSLRTATIPTGEPSALVSATPEGVSFYSLLQRDGSVGSPLPSLVTYAWDAAQGCLRQTLTPGRSLSSPGPTGSVYAWDTGTGSSCVGRSSTAPSLTTPWFRYYTSSTATSPLAITDAGLSLTDRRSVTSIRVTVPVSGARTLTSRTPTTVSVDVRVLLANVALAAGGQA